MSTCTRIALLAALCLLPAVASSSSSGAEVREAKPQAFKVADRGDLLLVVPDGWTSTVRRAPTPAGVVPTVVLTPKTAAGKRPACQVMITPIPSRDAKANTPEALKQVAEARGKMMLPTAKESKLDVQELKGDAATGYYYTLTDKAPKPGEFEYVTSCFVGVGDLLLSATVLHHAKDAPERQAALDMLKNAKQAPGNGKAAADGAPADDAKGAELRVAAPGAKWSLVIGGGLKVIDDQSDARAKARQVTAVNEETGMIVSVFLEPGRTRTADSTAVRNVYWSRAKNSPIPKKDIKLGKAGEYATVQYVVPDLDQKNLNVYIAHQGTWIDVHLSKADFTDKDQAEFDRIVKSIKFDAGGGK